MKITIYGAGSIGGWIGARLALAGEQVSAIARGTTLKALQADGIRLVHGDTSVTAPLSAVADPSELGPQDLVVVAVKAPAMPGVAQSIGPLLGPDTIVLTAMNGIPWWFFDGFGGELSGTRLCSIDPEGELAKLIPGRHIVGCVVHASCSLDSPGVVRQHFGNKLIVGEPSGGSSDRVRHLTSLLSRAGFDAVLSERIQADVWYKLWGNMTINPVSAVTGATIDKMLEDPQVLELIARVMREAREVGKRIGLPIVEEPEDRLKLLFDYGAFKSSMLQDVEAGRSVELDAIVTAVHELGRLTETSTPFTDGLLGLARLHARMRGLY